MDVRRVAVPAAAVLLSGLLGGCGSGGGDELIASSTSEALHAQVRAVREALAAGRDGAAASAVANLREDIRQLAESRELNAEDALVLLAQVDRLATGIEKPATPTPTPTPEPAAEPDSRTDSGGSAGDGSGNSGDSGGGDAGGADKAKGKPNGKGKGKNK